MTTIARTNISVLEEAPTIFPQYVCFDLAYVSKPWLIIAYVFVIYIYIVLHRKPN